MTLKIIITSVFALLSGAGLSTVIFSSIREFREWEESLERVLGIEEPRSTSQNNIWLVMLSIGWLIVLGTVDPVMRPTVTANVLLIGTSLSGLITSSIWSRTSDSRLALGLFRLHVFSTVALSLSLAKTLIIQ